MHNTLNGILVLLTSAVMAVALFRALRLPAMLAYFMVGLLLGPQVFAVFPDIEASRELGEFGIVFLMFSIGLEFSLPKLYSMRRTVVGVGGAQVLITLLSMMGLGLMAGISWQAALVIASALTMSSTAIVSKMLVERVDLNSRHGRLSISVLLFQDIAVVPLLILIPALASSSSDLVTTLLGAALKAGILLSILLVFGKPLMNRWFALVARQRSRELFVMNVLMVTLMLAAATKLAGLSYALGAFVAGMLISETRYRYQVESDIAPFRDILLGMFFISIGMLLDLHALANNLGIVLLTVLGLILLKAFVVTIIARLFKFEMGVAIRTGVTLAQAGEFSFVLLALGLEQHLITGHVLQIALAAALISMAVAPFIIQYNLIIAEKLSRSYIRNRNQQLAVISTATKTLKNHVIICGYGRSGQYLGRFLSEEEIPFIALDIDPARVQEAAAAGENVMYGDAGRRVVLEAAGASLAKALIISYIDAQSAHKILHVVQDLFPALPVIVRTFDESDMESFRAAGATEVVPEILEGSLMLASHALVLLGVPLNRVVKRIRRFREERYKMFRGFFHGVSDIENPVMDKNQARLHTVVISSTDYCVNKRLIDVWLSEFDVEIHSMRRINIADFEHTPDTVFLDGDVVVLLGTPANMSRAEQMLLTGKTT